MSLPRAQQAPTSDTCNSTVQAEVARSSHFLRFQNSWRLCVLSSSAPALPLRGQHVSHTGRPGSAQPAAGASPLGSLTHAHGWRGVTWAWRRTREAPYNLEGATSPRAIKARGSWIKRVQKAFFYTDRLAFVFLTGSPRSEGVLT